MRGRTRRTHRIPRSRKLLALTAALAAGTAGSIYLGAHEPTEAAPNAAPGAGPKAAAAAAAAEKDVTAVMFEWSFASIGRACTDSLGPAGYGSVQVSPPMERIKGEQWWTGYQPVSYDIASSLGDLDAFKAMVKSCHDAGVKVVSDAVINHMTAGSGTGTGGSSYTKYDYPGLYQAADMNDCTSEIKDYTNRAEVQNCELVGLADLDTGEEHVRGAIAGYLNDLMELGVDGFRIDAAKHMPADDLKAIKAKLSNPDAYWKQEVIPAASEPIKQDEYLGTGDVQEFNLAYALKSAFESGNPASLKNVTDGKLPSESAATFVTNHDTERQGNTLTYKNGAAYTLAHVFLLAHPYGQPDVHSGYVFDDKDAGAPDGGNADCSSDAWVCQHAQREIASMVGFRNAAGDAELTDWWDNGGSAIAFGRGDKAYVAINGGDGELTETFKTSLPAGEYCDVQSGKPVTVGDGGELKATLAAQSALAVHVNATSCDGN